MKQLLSTVLLAVITATLFAQTDTLFYSVVNKGKVTGLHTSWQTSPGEYHYTFHFNDRGRGDSNQSVIHINREGLITAAQITGVDYMKSPYAEYFEIRNDSAIWTINGTRKAEKFSGQMYTLGSSVPAAFALFLQKLSTQKDRKMDILPKGTIHCDEPLLKTIAFHGKTSTLKLYAVYFDPEPTPAYVWLTPDLHFFGFVNPWLSVVPRGYESWTDTLYALQELAGQGFYQKQVREYSNELPAHMAFTHTNLFRSSTATVQKDMTVELLNARIVAIYPSSGRQPEKNDSVIDCKGKFLMPGLWDMHSHYGKEEGLSYLAGGVTHVRDMGNEKILLTYKKQIADNVLLGPDISYISGFIDKEGPFQGPVGTIVASLDEALAAIDSYHQLGYQQIKIYSSILPEWVAPMANRAHSLGMRVCGHIPSKMTAEQAIHAGYDEITHMNFVFLNFMGDTVDTRSPARFRLPGLYGGQLDLQSKPVQEFISLMKQKKISLDPTMVVWDEMFNSFKNDTNHVLAPIRSWIPEQELATITNTAPYGSDSDQAAYKACFANMLRLLKILHDQGILLVPGTDGGELGAGEANAVHCELKLYTDAGIPANEVLKMATYDCALDCGLQDQYGDIRPGLEADLILVDGDPTGNIRDIRRVEWVIKNKRMYHPKQLLAAKGWKYYY